MGKDLQINLVIDGKKSSKGLLVNFIREKADKYQEPSREGTPKGEPIGFPTKKYAATLFSLTSLKLKDISKVVGVSYGVMRNWNSEKAFQKQVEDHILEFKSVFINFVLKVWGENPSALNGLFALDLSQLHDFPNFPALPSEIHKDAAFSKDLEGSILNEFAGMSEEHPEGAIFGLALINFWNLQSSLKNKRSLEDAVLDIHRQRMTLFGVVSKALCEDISEIFRKETITKSDREKGLIEIEQLQGFLWEIDQVVGNWK